MFDLVTKHKRLLQVILGLMILPFAFFGIDSYTRSGAPCGEAASVDGTSVSVRELAEETRRQFDRLRQMLGAGADPAALDTPEMRQAILESLISQRLITNEVSKAHLALSKEAVVASILGAPEFQENGKFSPERYAGYLRVLGMSDEGNVAKLRLEIPAAQLASAIAGSAIQPRTVVDRLAAIEAEKREVAEAFIPAEAYLARVKPDEAAMKAFYESHLADYKVPERVRAEYAVLSAEALAQAEGATRGGNQGSLRRKGGRDGRAGAAPLEPHPACHERGGGENCRRGAQEPAGFRRSGEKAFAGHRLRAERRRPGHEPARHARQQGAGGCDLQPEAE